MPLNDGGVEKSSFHSRCHFGTSVGPTGTLESRSFVAVVVSCAVSTSDFQSEVGEIFGEIGGELPAKFGRRFSSFFCWGKSSETFSTKTPPQISPSNFTTRFWAVAVPSAVYREAPVWFGSVTVWGWNGSSGSGFRFRRFLCKKGFSAFQYRFTKTGKDGSGSGFGSWKMVLAVPVPLSVSGKTVLTVSARAPLCCKNMCCASRFCTGGGVAAGSRSKQRPRACKAKC